MENQLDPTVQDQTQPVTADLEASENETTCESSADTKDETTNEPDVTDQSSTTLTHQAEKAIPGKVPIKPARAQEELHPNPLLLDPYEWNKCTITVGYSLLPNGRVSVSVHNHKDEPIVKEFHVDEVPLPEKISGVMATLRSIWTRSPVNTTVVLLPKPEMAFERPMIASVQVATDTPIVQEGFESDLPLPAPIVDMLDELKELIPARALKNMEKNAKAKTPVKVKAANKATTPKAAAPASTPAVNKNIEKSQLTLF
jgi:hypothetical protein